MELFLEYFYSRFNCVFISRMIDIKKNCYYTFKDFLPDIKSTQVAKLVGPSLAVCGTRWKMVGLGIIMLENGWEIAGAGILLI